MGCYLSKSIASVVPHPTGGNISYAGMKESSIAPEPIHVPSSIVNSKSTHDQIKEDDSNLQYKDVSEMINSKNIVAAVKRGDLKTVKVLAENDEIGNGINSTGISIRLSKSSQR